MFMHTMKIIKTPSDVAEFWTTTYGGHIIPAKTFAVRLDGLLTKVFRIVTAIPEEDVDVVNDVTFMINSAMACQFALCVAEVKDPGESFKYSILGHCVAMTAVENIVAELETWIEWAAEEYGVDVDVVLH